MISAAALGVPAVAAAWSPAEEERRKGMLAYLSEGLPLLVFDYTGRRNGILGSDRGNAYLGGVFGPYLRGDEDGAYSRDHDITFTGNNIAPCGDLSSRCLTARIDVDRPDPEHRNFTHPFPSEWTRQSRKNPRRALRGHARQPR